jgi:pimeloyl-ACP methyl ester carboxylesterase
MSTDQGFLDVNGARLCFESHGAGRPLLLLHGGTADLHMWDDWLPLLADDFRVIRLDSRGHGRSSNPAGLLTYPLMADDVAAAIAALGLDRPLVAGFSDGGQIALELAMRHPASAAAIVVGGAYGTFADHQRSTLKSFGLPAPGVVDFDALLTDERAGTVEYWRATHATPDDPERWRTLLTQIAGLWWSPLNYQAADYQRIQIPTLIFAGDRDEFVSAAHAAEMYQQLPNAELAIIPNAAHLGSIDSDGPTPGIVMNFLRRVP